MQHVRTTIQPGEVIQVSPAEFLDLDRQGLILEVVTPTAPTVAKATDAGDSKTASGKPAGK